MSAAGSDRIVLESRGPADRHDRVHIDALRARKMVHAVRFEHVAGSREPLLGAAGAL
ncbi:hypothetical protein GCM10017714_27370 [Curtobacterium pusillum]|nr:hypothetical protein GCM10017610_31520 [Curtobacterium pusillum]